MGMFCVDHRQLLGYYYQGELTNVEERLIIEDNNK